MTDSVIGKCSKCGGEVRNHTGPWLGIHPPVPYCASCGATPKRPTIEMEGGDANSAARELGRLGGLIGGKARAEKLSPERRSEISRNAANARWNKPG